MIGLARITLKGQTHVTLVHNLLKRLYNEFGTRSQDTHIIIPHNCSETASRMMVAKENALPSNCC